MLGWMSVKEREWGGGGGYKVKREGCYYAAQMSCDCVAASFRSQSVSVLLQAGSGQF